MRLLDQRVYKARQTFLCLFRSRYTAIHVTRKISRNGFSDEFMDIVSTVLDPNFNQCSVILSRSKTERNTLYVRTAGITTEVWS